MIRTIENRRGLTFLEIMIVIVIIGIMAALMIPNFNGPRQSIALRSTTRQIAAQGALARQYAIAHNQEVDLLFNAEERWFRMVMPLPRDEDQFRRRLDEDEPNSEEELERPLHELVRFVELRRDNIELDDEEERLTFYPNGTCSGMTIHVANKRGDSMSVEFERATGQVSIYTGEPKSFAQKLRDRGLNPEDYGIEDDGTSIADAGDKYNPGGGFGKTAGWDKEQRVSHYEDVADRIARRSAAKYHSSQEGGPAEYYSEASRWGN